MKQEEMKKTIARVLADLIADPAQNREDVNHFLKVHAYAEIIGCEEGLDPETQFTLELAACVHDIACPACREKYGDTNGAHQEAESERILRPFLSRYDLPEKIRERVIALVCRHHTYTDVDGSDCQILLEADYLVNCDESEKYRKSFESFRRKVFRTGTGIRLLEDEFPEEAGREA